MPRAFRHENGFEAHDRLCRNFARQADDTRGAMPYAIRQQI